MPLSGSLSQKFVGTATGGRLTPLGHPNLLFKHWLSKNSGGWDHFEITVYLALWPGGIAASRGKAAGLYLFHRHAISHTGQRIEAKLGITRVDISC